MAKMGKLTPEEEARNKMLMRERDRERKRMKRLNPEYRRMEQERDRDRKKARRSNEAFRQLEKLRDKIRKERKKGATVPLTEEEVFVKFVVRTPLTVEPEMSKTSVQAHACQSTTNIAATNMSSTAQSSNSATTTTTATTTAANSAANTPTSQNVHQAPTAHLTQLNKGILYPPPNFAHHPLPIAGVTLMPQLCHPILHQNLSATLYPANGIKQEYTGIKQEYHGIKPEYGCIKQEYHGVKQEYIVNETTSATSPSLTTSSTAGQVSGNARNVGGAGGVSVNGEEREVPLIEPEIILHTSTDVIAAPHHFHNHAAHSHHLHQQHSSMFQHISPQAHMTQMRTHAPLPLPPPATHAQQHQQMPHYASNKGS